MGTQSSNLFDRLPDEIIENIFMQITYSPPVEPSNHVNDPSTGSSYFAYVIHEPYLQRTFKSLISLELVCRRFHNILRSPTFWRRKCHQDHVAVINEPLAIEQNVDFRRLYFSNPFHPDYNVLKFVKIPHNDEERLWRPKVDREIVPIGCDILYDAFKQVSPCFVTSYVWANYEQGHIHLLRRGQKQVRQLRTMIEFSVCIAGRWDCSYEYRLRLHFSDGHIWQYQGRGINGDSKWRRITYRYGRYAIGQKPPNVSIQMEGKDRQFWAGNFGAKFAQIKLRLVLRGDNDQDVEQNEEILKEPEIMNPDQYNATHN